MDHVTINDQDFMKDIEEQEIARLHAAGQDAEVQYADGALWLYTVAGRCIKLNDM